MADQIPIHWWQEQFNTHNYKIWYSEIMTSTLNHDNHCTFHLVNNKEGISLNKNVNWMKEECFGEFVSHVPENWAVENNYWTLELFTFSLIKTATTKNRCMFVCEVMSIENANDSHAVWYLLKKCKQNSKIQSISSIVMIEQWIIISESMMQSHGAMYKCHKMQGTYRSINQIRGLANTRIIDYGHYIFVWLIHTERKLHTHISNHAYCVMCYTHHVW